MRKIDRYCKICNQQLCWGNSSGYCRICFNKTVLKHVEEKYCIVCGKKINKYKDGLRCRDCSNKLNRHPDYSGENNPNWKNGRSTIKYPFKFFSKRKTIFQRDKFQCQKCGITNDEYLILFNKSLDVHHIDFNKFNNDDSNLITLCRKCNVRADNHLDWIQQFKEITCSIKN